VSSQPAALVFLRRFYLRESVLRYDPQTTWYAVRWASL
jgi:hypothetical protein